jgi:ferrochelatase
MIERTRDALAQIPSDQRSAAHLLFTAHSIPLAMAENCQYEAQFRESSRLVAEALGHADWRLVYQSRSGPPSQPWLGPDIGDALDAIAKNPEGQGSRRADVVVVPIGFVSDHMEVLYDLDEEAKQRATALGLNFIRAGTVGKHPRFVQMIRELVEERINSTADRLAIGSLGPSHDVCPPDCCPRGSSPARNSEKRPS